MLALAAIFTDSRMLARKGRMYAIATTPPPPSHRRRRSPHTNPLNPDSKDPPGIPIKIQPHPTLSLPI